MNVAFVRDPSSDEIYTSPLSYGVQPFVIDMANRRAALKIDVPALVKPGETLQLQVLDATRLANRPLRRG